MNMGQGVNGFYVGGSTGEAFLMSLEERKKLLEVVADEAQGNTRIISHIGCIGTADTITLGLHAKGIGVDAVSVIPPFYYKFSFDVIKDHYFNIVSALKMPLIVYNFPSYSGVELNEENIRELLVNEYIIGIKHTSMNLYQIERMKACDRNLLILNGHDEVFLGALAMGCDGAIGSTYNFMADRFIKIEAYYRKGMIGEAQRLQIEANDIIAALIRAGVFQRIKYILGKLGIDCGCCRQPFRKPAPADIQQLDAVIGKYLLEVKS